MQWMYIWFKVKLSPKCNRGFICDWIWVKPSGKCIIMTKEALLRCTIVWFSGTFILKGSAIFRTLRRLGTTWNFARSITRVSTHEHEHWEHCLCTQSLLKRRFWTTHISCCISGARPSWQTKSVDPQVRPSGRRVMVRSSSSLVPCECMDVSLFCR